MTNILELLARHMGRVIGKTHGWEINASTNLPLSKIYKALVCHSATG